MEERPSSSSRGETEADAGRGRVLGGNEGTLQGDAKEDEERGERRAVQEGEQPGDRVRFMTDEGGEAEDSEERDESVGGEADGSELEGGMTAEL